MFAASEITLTDWTNRILLIEQPELSDNVLSPDLGLEGAEQLLRVYLLQV